MNRNTVHIDDYRRGYSPQLIRQTKVSKLRGEYVWVRVLYPSPTQTIQEKIAVYEQAKAECKQLMAVEKDPVDFELLQVDYAFIKSMLYLYRKGATQDETKTK